MATQTTIRTRKEPELELRVKAALLDDLLELIDEKLLGHIMKATEKEENIPLSKAKKLLVP